MKKQGWLETTNLNSQNAQNVMYSSVTVVYSVNHIADALHNQ